ncbi:MAG: hypothetical protein COW16_06745 [Sphingomonadales bacterium CG12_big_fil_rev_8_21_14_0_65_65_10]|nr:MAG: hypothetical protein COW16_06745 [Sphingomonadales bacterium CG12_big_fil_rev_8_21_14_0_65_65_10]
MKPMNALILAGLASGLAACSPAPDNSQDDAAAAAVETVSLDPAALHALLVEEADNLVPSDWQTGAPAPETALAYWHLPELELHEQVSRTAECTAYPGPGNAHDCTLTFTSDNSAAEDAEDRRTVTAFFRFDVRANDDDSLTLLSPNVRWAVQG